VRMTLVCIDVEGRVLRISTFEGDRRQGGGTCPSPPCPTRVPALLQACMSDCTFLDNRKGVRLFTSGELQSSYYTVHKTVGTFVFSTTNFFSNMFSTTNIFGGFHNNFLPSKKC
jgi:hypothetical protein